ncbi:hypothetical protein TVAG_272770 [Trichomonas vaginalis G3]|uniref:Uncharacterized protein n=1 Tax=Trichomonas vaginalis (strain ATCC PRA-98 / G3) TaxID=412133 RepID=A2F0F7_TRIV3|nr:hypothetical protein TVAG_272770 [Trichomonas vaginalis G3]|eukprot:XP_001330333.1 hypothetical protein [Trichomonas vaginalis G3]
MQHPPPDPPCEVDQAIGYLQYSRFVIAAELHGNIRFVKDPQLVHQSWVWWHCVPPYPILVNLTLYKTANVHFTTRTQN